jgi:hypothetical protein
VDTEGRHRLFSTPRALPEHQIHALDKSVYIAFTAQNSLFSNIFGEIVRSVEVAADGSGSTFM